MNVSIVTPPPIKVNFQTPTNINVQVGVPGNIKVSIGGIIGNGSDSTIVKAIAAETISGGKVVVIINGEAYVYNTADENHYLEYTGIANTAALVGEELDITVWGKIKEVGSGWEKGKNYYVGSNGLLTSSIPTSGTMYPIAIGIATDTVLITNNFLKIIQS